VRGFEVELHNQASLHGEQVSVDLELALADLAAHPFEASSKHRCAMAASLAS